MKIAYRTIQEFGRIITGDSSITPYKTGSDLVRFFNELGFNDRYEEGFPSRWKYTEDCLISMNRDGMIKKALLTYLNPVNFVENKNQLTAAIEKLNTYLIYDGYECALNGRKINIREISEVSIQIENEEKLSSDFAKEQIKKCEDKITSCDFDGAITNARSLLEDVIKDLYKQKTGCELELNGDLIDYYKNLKKELNLSESAVTDKALKQITSGLTQIVHGLATVRNKMSDGHSREVKPFKHHAKLIVNSSKTLVDFLYDTHEFQNKGFIRQPSSE